MNNSTNFGRKTLENNLEGNGEKFKQMFQIK